MGKWKPRIQNNTRKMATLNSYILTTYCRWIHSKNLCEIKKGTSKISKKMRFFVLVGICLLFCSITGLIGYQFGFHAGEHVRTSHQGFSATDVKPTSNNRLCNSYGDEIPSWTLPVSKQEQDTSVAIYSENILHSM